MGTKKITFNNKTAIIPKAVHENQVWDEDVNEIKDVVNSNADQQITNTQDINNLKNKDYSMYQLVANMKTDWIKDTTGQKYPAHDLVRGTFINSLIAFGCSGLISKLDSLTLTDVSNTVLRVSANDHPIMFYNKIYTDFANTLKLFPQQDFPLQNIPDITTDGTFIRYVAYLDDGSLHFSNQSFTQDDNYCQLGRILIKRVGGVNSFVDAFGTGTRNVKNLPDIAGYNDLLRVYSPLSSDVELKPNANMTMNHAGGSLTGMSISWGEANQNIKTILAQNPVSFSRINPSTSQSSTPPPIVTNLDVTTYWNGTALVAVPTNGNATVQKVMISDNGTIVIQAGEIVFDNFQEAKDGVSTAPFTAILPKASYVEIGRIVAVKSTTNLSNEADAQFYNSSSAGGGGGSASAGTDISIAYTPTAVVVISSTGLDGSIGAGTAITAGILTSEAQSIWGPKTFESGEILLKGQISGVVGKIFKQNNIFIFETEDGYVGSFSKHRLDIYDSIYGRASILANLISNNRDYSLPDKTGTFALTSDFTGYIKGAGTTNYIPKFSDVDAVTNSQIFDNGTSVLIGTNVSNGVDKIQVNGSVLASQYKVNVPDTSGASGVFVNVGGASNVNNPDGVIVKNDGRVTDGVGGIYSFYTELKNVDARGLVISMIGTQNCIGININSNDLSSKTGFAIKIDNNIENLFTVNEFGKTFTKVLLVNTSVDNSVDKLQVNGTVSGSPATLSNQFVTLQQLNSNSVLKPLDEGNGIGWAYMVDRTNFGNIGLDALDFSWSDDGTGTMGATGESSFAQGINVIASGYSSTSFGYLVNNAAYGGFVTGFNNKTAGYTNFVAGIGQDVTGTNVTVVGQGAEIINDSIITFNDPNATVFAVGNGTIQDADPDYTVTSRSTALRVLKSGLVLAEKQTNNLIESNLASIISYEFLATKIPFLSSANTFYATQKIIQAAGQYRTFEFDATAATGNTGAFLAKNPTTMSNNRFRAFESTGNVNGYDTRFFLGVSQGTQQAQGLTTPTPELVLSQNGKINVILIACKATEGASQINSRLQIGFDQYSPNASDSAILSVNGAIREVVQTFADNAAAITGGLTSGMHYRTSTGTLMIVY